MTQTREDGEDGPMVGPFWRVPRHRGGARLIGLPRPHRLAAAYGANLTVEEGHAGIWDRIMRQSAGWFARNGVSPAIIGTEYDAWPRGRVVHSTETGRSTVMASRRLFPPHALHAVERLFRLAPGSYAFLDDAHYRPAASRPERTGNAWIGITSRRKDTPWT